VARLAFRGQRIRRAIGLLRARPHKDLSIDELASQVGLSRSRFYDLLPALHRILAAPPISICCRRDRGVASLLGAGQDREASASRFSRRDFTRFFLQQSAFARYFRRSTAGTGSFPSSKPPSRRTERATRHWIC